MSRRNSKLKRPSQRNPWTWLLCSVFFLSCSTCSLFQKPKDHFVEVGEAKVVGQVWQGELRFEPGADPKGTYLVMTKKTYVVIVGLHYKVRGLELEVARLKELVEKGK